MDLDECHRSLDIAEIAASRFSNKVRELHVAEEILPSPLPFTTLLYTRAFDLKDQTPSKIKD